MDDGPELSAELSYAPGLDMILKFDGAERRKWRMVADVRLCELLEQYPGKVLVLAMDAEQGWLFCGAADGLSDADRIYHGVASEYKGMQNRRPVLFFTPWQEPNPRFNLEAQLALMFSLEARGIEH